LFPCPPIRAPLSGGISQTWCVWGKISWLRDAATASARVKIVANLARFGAKKALRTRGEKWRKLGIYPQNPNPPQGRYALFCPMQGIFAQPAPPSLSGSTSRLERASTETRHLQRGWKLHGQFNFTTRKGEY